MAENEPKRIGRGKPTWLRRSLLVVMSLFILLFAASQPDRPVATILPGSSAGPEFIVQIIRPRAGLPLGGMLPPQLFGLDAHLGFDSKSTGAVMRSAGAGGVEFGADDWQVDLVLDADGGVTAETQVVFDLVFEGSKRRVRCRPGVPAVGTIRTTPLAGPGELSGHFDIELSRCEDAVTGKSLGWPTKPLVLHGSFDRLPPGAKTDRH